MTTVLILLFTLLSLISSNDIKLTNDSAIIAQIGDDKKEIKLLIDPMSAMTFIFASNIPKDSISIKQGIKLNVTTTYGQFSGNFFREDFILKDDPKITFKLSFLYVTNTTSPLNKTYDGIIGLGYFNKSSDSFYNKTFIRPILKINLEKGLISFGELSYFTNLFKPVFHIKSSKKDVNTILFDINSIKVDQSSEGHPIKGSGKIDLWKKNYIMAPSSQEKQLFFRYFNDTTKGGLIYTDENNSDEYKNYFYPLSVDSSKKAKSYIEIENKRYPFSLWYNEKGKDIAYSTVKLQLASNNEDWMIGAQALGFDTIEFDFENNVVYGYNKQCIFTWAYLITGVIGIIAIVLSIYFMKKKPDQESKRQEETELIDKRKQDKQ